MFVLHYYCFVPDGRLSAPLIQLDTAWLYSIHYTALYTIPLLSAHSAPRDASRPGSEQSAQLRARRRQRCRESLSPSVSLSLLPLGDDKVQSTPRVDASTARHACMY